MNRRTKDNVYPTLQQIQQRFENGNYSHEIENTIASLLNIIQEQERNLFFAEKQLEHQLKRQYDA
jgi:hypothetical protein